MFAASVVTLETPGNAAFHAAANVSIFAFTAQNLSFLYTSQTCSRRYSTAREVTRSSCFKRSFLIRLESALHERELEREHER